MLLARQQKVTDRGRQAAPVSVRRGKPIAPARRARRVAFAAMLLWGALLAVPAGRDAAGRDDPADGAVEVNGLRLPLSSLLSPEAHEYMRHVIVDKPFGRPEEDIAAERRRQDRIMDDFLRPMLHRYEVDIAEQQTGGIFTQVVVPAAGIAPRNRNRVLLNLHGGGFTTGARSASLVESVPLAAVMGIKVIAIDYRMSPEFRFPAASIDVEAVYRSVLKDYEPQNIGLFGCSAGGALTAQSLAWFRHKGLPMPGAAGIFCAGLGRFFVGDAAGLAASLNGIRLPVSATTPRSSAANKSLAPEFAYLASAAASDPLAYPIVSPELLAAFPPVLFITATRAFEFSAVVDSHNVLAKSGTRSILHAWDGLNHGFFYNSDLPESRDAYDIMARFFDTSLGSHEPVRPGSNPSQATGGGNEIQETQNDAAAGGPCRGGPRCGAGTGRGDGEPGGR